MQTNSKIHSSRPPFKYNYDIIINWYNLLSSFVFGFCGFSVPMGNWLKSSQADYHKHRWIHFEIIYNVFTVNYKNIFYELFGVFFSMQMSQCVLLPCSYIPTLKHYSYNIHRCKLSLPRSHQNVLHRKTY